MNACPALPYLGHLHSPSYRLRETDGGLPGKWEISRKLFDRVFECEDLKENLQR
jgi:hypothetical protein